MKLIIAKPRGWCAGVSRAIQTVDSAIEKIHAEKADREIYVYHEIVHNKVVIDGFKEKNIKFVESLDEIKNKTNSVIIFSAHGSATSLFERAKREGMYVIDATCPLVKSVHKNAQTLEENGFEVIIIGHKNHPEVIGTIGQLKTKAHVVGDVEDVARISIKNEDIVGYVTQTTLNIDDTLDIVRELRKRFPKLKESDKSNICYATRNRQEAVKKMLESIDMLIVVGSNNSSNATRLAEIGSKCRLGSIMINSYNDLMVDHFKDSNCIGITAGASTPEFLVQGVISWFQENFSIEVSFIEGKDETTIFTLPKELRQLTTSD